MLLFRDPVGDQRLSSCDKFKVLLHGLFGRTRQLQGIKNKEGYLSWAGGGYMRKRNKVCLVPGVIIVFIPLVSAPPVRKYM